MFMFCWPTYFAATARKCELVRLILMFNQLVVVVETETRKPSTQLCKPLLLALFVALFDRKVSGCKTKKAKLFPLAVCFTGHWNSMMICNLKLNSHVRFHSNCSLSDIAALMMESLFCCVLAFITWTIPNDIHKKVTIVQWKRGIRFVVWQVLFHVVISCDTQSLVTVMNTLSASLDLMGSNCAFSFFLSFQMSVLTFIVPWKEINKKCNNVLLQFAGPIVWGLKGWHLILKVDFFQRRLISSEETIWRNVFKTCLFPTPRGQISKCKNQRSVPNLLFVGDFIYPQCIFGQNLHSRLLIFSLLLLPMLSLHQMDMSFSLLSLQSVRKTFPPWSIGNSVYIHLTPRFCTESNKPHLTARSIQKNLNILTTFVSTLLQSCACFLFYGLFMGSASGSPPVFWHGGPTWVAWEQLHQEALWERVHKGMEGTDQDVHMLVKMTFAVLEDQSWVRTGVCWIYLVWWRCVKDPGSVKLNTTLGCG